MASLGRALSLEWKAVPLRTNADVAEAVARGDVEMGALPVENTLAGSVTASYDALIETDEIIVVHETVLPIHHCLMAPPSATLATLVTVESHPVALAQCTVFFGRHPWLRQQASFDTAGAAREVGDSGDSRRGAIAARVAAERYGLTILAENIEDRPDNQTRFLAFVKRGSSASEIASRTLARSATHQRTILAITTENAPGALFRALEPFANRGLNLVKIESRPTGEPWTYRFILDVEGDAAPAIDELRTRTAWCRVIGTYARDAALRY